MKWYNENKDKDNFFRMGFVGGKLCVCKGNDASKLAPIAFDQLVCSTHSSATTICQTMMSGN
mgnify:CR=1 FL=1